MVQTCTCWAEDVEDCSVVTHLSITPIFSDWCVDLWQRRRWHSTHCHCAAGWVQVGCNSSSLTRTVAHYRQSVSEERIFGSLISSWISQQRMNAQVVQNETPALSDIPRALLWQKFKTCITHNRELQYHLVIPYTILKWGRKWEANTKRATTESSSGYIIFN